MKIYIATCCNYNSDGPHKPAVLGAFKSRSDAEAAVLRDIDEWCAAADPYDDDPHAEGYARRNFADMAAWLDLDDPAGCEWNIEEVAIPADWTNDGD